MRRLIVTVPVIIPLLTGVFCVRDNMRELREEGFERTFHHDGIERTYRLYIPQSLQESHPAPLVLALHGGGGTAGGMQQLTYGGFNRLADSEGFIVCYPQGLERSWNDGRDDALGYAHLNDIDDVGFLSGLIDYLVESYSADSTRVYVTGISNGGMMAFRLACELSDKIAAIAPVSTAMPVNLPDMCQPQLPVSVIMFAGTDDPLVPYQGGQVHIGQQERGAVLSVPKSISYWVIHNECSASPIVTDEPDRDPGDGTRVRKEAYVGGLADSEVVLYVIEGGGHTWPSGWKYLGERIIGKTSQDIDANRLIWDFFKRHRN